MIPRGLHNNNPLNIRRDCVVYAGEIEGMDESFKTFSSMAYGYRAAFVILATYLSKGYNSIEKIVGRWAPPSENDTERYIDRVEKVSGIARNKELTASDGGDYLLLVAAMSLVENGINADIQEVTAGFHLQSKFVMR